MSFWNVNIGKIYDFLLNSETAYVSKTQNLTILLRYVKMAK